MELVTTTEEIASNLLRFDRYRTSMTSEVIEYFKERLRLGDVFVVAQTPRGAAFCPSRFVGYSGCTMEKHLAFPDKHGGLASKRISSLLGAPIPATSDKASEGSFLKLCKDLGIVPKEIVRKFWRLKSIEIKSVPNLTGGEPGFPDEVEAYVEGAAIRVFVNAYERNPKARQACINHYGARCIVCRFDFSKEYGKRIGDGFIHVHHTFPLHLRKAKYNVDPIEDLKPVCPNCHAMLHKSDPPYSVKDIQSLLKKAREA